MMKKQDREAKGEFWLRHLRDCMAAGKRLADYAREHELDVDEGYRWTRVLRRAGRWPAQKSDGAEASPIVAHKAVARFARVRIDSARSELAAPLRMLVALANGRRAELVLSDEGQLARVISLLEHTA
jgi:hypothetical protein